MDDPMVTITKHLKFNVVLCRPQLDVRRTSDQVVAGSWRLIMKYFLRSLSPFR